MNPLYNYNNDATLVITGLSSRKIQKAKYLLELTSENPANLRTGQLLYSNEATSALLYSPIGLYC